MSAAVAGGVIAIYQFVYGIAAFGVGPRVDRGVSLSSLYGWRSQDVKPLRGNCTHSLRATKSQQIRRESRRRRRA